MRIFIGYDKNESVAYHVLSHSIMRHASAPISITPICLDNLKDCYWRKRDRKQSTDFSFSRFLTPYLNSYERYALWMDCDMLCRGDIVELYETVTGWRWEEHHPFGLPPDKSVFVVKHDYTPSCDTKFLGQQQTKYQKKNWSSVMLFRTNHQDCRKLTPEYVNTASGLELHQFQWTTEDRIGELPRQWNWLVGEYPYNPDAKLVHFTIGGPYFNAYKDCDYADEWFEERARMLHVKAA